MLGNGSFPLMILKIRKTFVSPRTIAAGRCARLSPKTTWRELVGFLGLCVCNIPPRTEAAGGKNPTPALKYAAD